MCNANYWLWSRMDKIRVDLIKRLHSGKYRFPKLQNRYLDMHHYKQMKLLTLNIQFNTLQIAPLEIEFGSKNKIDMSNLRRIEDQWNSQPANQRASTFKTTDTILYLATQVKLPLHLKTLINGFLEGWIPRKQSANATPICIHCSRIFANMDHFSESCAREDYISRQTIYTQLKSRQAGTIIATLKMLKQSVKMVFNLPQEDQ